MVNHKLLRKIERVTRIQTELIKEIEVIVRELIDMEVRERSGRKSKVLIRTIELLRELQIKISEEK